MVRQDRPMRGPFAALRAERRNVAARARVVDEIRHEFEAFPAMRLTAPQVRRLFALPSDVCQRVLTGLCRDHVLCLGRDGRYGRRED